MPDTASEAKPVRNEDRRAFEEGSNLLLWILRRLPQSPGNHADNSSSKRSGTGGGLFPIRGRQRAGPAPHQFPIWPTGGGNRIPSQINSIARNILNFYPRPNVGRNLSIHDHAGSGERQQPVWSANRSSSLLQRPTLPPLPVLPGVDAQSAFHQRSRCARIPGRRRDPHPELHGLAHTHLWTDAGELLAVRLVPKPLRFRHQVEPHPAILFGIPYHAVLRSSGGTRSEEHTSELQSHHDLVCRLLLEKKKDL